MNLHPRIAMPKKLISLIICCFSIVAGFAGIAQSQSEWDKTVEAATKEAAVVVGAPASAELRKGLEGAFAKRFPGVELEISTARGPTNASKIAAEHAAGVRYYDVLISG